MKNTDDFINLYLNLNNEQRKEFDKWEQSATRKELEELDTGLAVLNKYMKVIYPNPPMVFDMNDLPVETRNGFELVRKRT